MSRYISAGLRQSVGSRAHFLCEYCLIAEEDTFFGCEVEHIISLKHGGASELANLAYACAFCNRHKGSDIGSVTAAGEFSRFFNPRTDRWADHFRLHEIVIQARTAIGEVTARILQLNHPDQLLERRALRAADRYPSRAALAHVGG